MAPVSGTPSADRETVRLRLENDELRRENERLRRRDAELVAYLRSKVDQMLTVIGTLPLRPDELDDGGLISFDPIGIVAESFSQILAAQREANAELKLARDKIDAIYNAVGAGIVVLDRNRRILSYNRKQRDLFFPGHHRIVGETCVSLLCRSEAPLPGCVFDKVLASGQPERTAEWPFAGQYFDVVGMPVKDRRGNVQQVVIVYHEITERKRAELELSAALGRTSEAREELEAIITSVNEGMLVVDRSGTIAATNPAAARMLGIPQEKVAGQRLAEISRISVLTEAVAVAVHRDEPGEPVDIVLEEGPERRFLQGRMALLHSSGGSVRGVVVTLVDVTRERRIEQMKSEFISTAAHELRTPVTTILGFSELLLDADAFSPEIRAEFIESINAKAEDLAHLIDDLLDLSRIEEGRDIPLVREPVALTPLVAGELDFLRKRHAGHRFVAEFPAEPVVVLGDARRLAQIFDNLFSNAVKYSAEGSTVTVTLRPDGFFCNVSVSDDGIGMTEEQVRRIFDKFYRADASDTAVSGTGLGMTIVRKLVQMHGGTIGVAAAPGEGTTVTFTLPLFSPAKGGETESSR